MTSRSRLAVVCDDLIEAGWLAALVIAALFFNPFAEDAFESNRFLILRCLAAVMLAAAAIQWLETAGCEGRAAAMKRLRAGLSRPLVVSVLLFAGTWVASTAASLEPADSWWGVLPRLHGSYSALAYLTIFLLMAPRLRDGVRQARWVTTLLLTSSGLCVYAVAQGLGWDPLSWSGLLAGRVMAHQGNPIFLGAFLAMAAPFALARSLLAWRRRDGWPAAVWTSLFVLQIGTLLLTGSRGPMLALLGGLVLSAAACALARGYRRPVLVLGALALAAVALAAADRGLGDRLAALTSPAATAGQRWLTWQATVTMLTDSPQRRWLGFGPEMMATAFPRYVPVELPGMRWQPDLYQDRAHNAVLDSLVSVGLAGTFLHLLILAIALALALRQLGLVPNRRWSAGLGVVLAGTTSIAAIGAWSASPGHGLVGLAAGTGPVAGAALYLLAVALFDPRRQPPDRDQIVVGGAIFAALVGHVLESQVGIAVAVSQTTFWMIAAWLAAGGPRSPTADAGISRAPTDRQRSPLALLTGLVLTTCTFTLWAPAESAGRPAALAAILIAVWATGGLIVLAAGAGPRRWPRVAGLSLAWSVPYLILHGGLVASADAAAKTVALYLVQLALAIGVLAVLLGRESGRLPAARGRRPASPGYVACYAAIAVALTLLPATANLDWVWAGLSMKAGRSAFADQRFDAARGHFEDAVRRVPGADEHHLALARAGIRQAAATTNPGRRSQLIEEVRQRLEEQRRQRPHNYGYPVELGYLHSKWSALATSPEDRDVHLQLASDAYAAADRLAPHSAPIQRSWGAVLLALGALDAATAHLERAAELSPRSVEGRLMLGRAYLEQGDFNAAGEAFARALDVDQKRAWQAIAGVARARPGDWRAQRDAALLLAVAGQRQQARAAAESAVALSEPPHRVVLEELYIWLARKP